ncbi:MAG: hypothetical protein ABIL09_10545, partial [Gemmatimonadota bacterium]
LQTWVRMTVRGELLSELEVDFDPGGVRAARVVAADRGPAGAARAVDCPGARPQDNLSVIFTVPPGALAEYTPVRMEVRGELLSELEVIFTPSGTRFTPWASLHYYLGIERVDLNLDQLGAVHIYDGGVEEPIETQINHTGSSSTVQIWLDVPGFSVYGLRD